ncbi:hypothetical protein [Streptomyces parvus]|uniref:hypothetical protein n=1 Tax=Streptomyces parvus TaxID=66428 RepID=UPI002101127A|nr:hypothetical protein [Streptomyces parvus]MCQ1576188.1 hypothetical protein [Streptomyces parvus]
MDIPETGTDGEPADELSACPACGNPPERILDGPRLRPPHQRWWECRACRWVGVLHTHSGHLETMRRLQGDEADCVFCGWEEENVVSEPFERDGERLDWLVCLACGRSNTRRLDGMADPE